MTSRALAPLFFTSQQTVTSTAMWSISSRKSTVMILVSALSPRIRLSSPTRRLPAKMALGCGMIIA